MSIDSLFSKRYDSTSYNCADFAAEAWKMITNQDIAEDLRGFMTTEPPFNWLRQRNAFERLSRPESPCLVLFRNRIGTPQPHVGIWMDRRVLHLCRRGVEFMPIECISHGFQAIRFYSCRK